VEQYKSGKTSVIDSWWDRRRRPRAASHAAAVLAVCRSFEIRIANVYTANNQIHATGYDGSGNQTTNGGYTFQYDAENRLIATNMYATSYGYDADGRRVTKTSSGVTTTYVYDITGQLAAQYATGGTTPCPATCYLMTDHLGSTRMQTDSAGNQLTLLDYAPFGEELAGLDGRDARWGGFGSGIHFTGKEQEGYEGDYMHYFGARYFSGGLGRFTSVDPSFESAILELPQTWNRYTYVYNRPTFATDPDGRCPPCVGAIIGGVVEGGWNLGTQFIAHGYSFHGTGWGEVGSNFVGGAVAGGLAVLTGGTSLVASELAGDVLAGAGSNVVGGIVTRALRGDSPEEAFSLGEIGTDAAGGFLGGGIGHFAAGVIHMPEDPALPNPRRHAVGRRKLAAYDAAVRNRDRALGQRAGIGTAAASPPAHAVTGLVDNFWRLLNWLVMAQPTEVVSSTITYQ
jgi:RHS repeat-associated protein